MGKTLTIPDTVAISFFKDVLKGEPTSDKHFARCPVCGDSATHSHRKRMYLLKKENNWIVYCHNCLYSASLLTLVKDFFPSYYSNILSESFNDVFLKPKEQKKDEELSLVVTDLYKRINRKVRKENPIKKHIKDNCVPLIEDCGKEDLQGKVNVQRALLKARLLPEAYTKNLYYAYQGEYEDRVIIPFFDENKEMYYFQAMGTQEWHKKNKYINWKDKLIEEKPLYNEKHINDEKTVYVVEGLFDSLFVQNAVATIGASLSSKKINSIRNKYKKRVWVIDNDETGFGLMGKLINMNESIFIMPYEHRELKDLNDLAKKIKKRNLTKIVESNTYNSIEGVMELVRRKKNVFKKSKKRKQI